MDFYKNIDVKGNKVTGLGTPVQDSDAATKKYVDDNIGSGGGSDPALEARVETLENQAASILTSFTDNFDNSNFIETNSLVNVARITSGGESYVAINPQTVAASSNMNTDVQSDQSSNITYSSGDVQNVTLQTGVFTTKALTVNAATQAQVSATFSAPTAFTFSNETNYSITGMTDNQFNHYTVADTDTRWYFYQTQVGWGNVYGYAINTSNNQVVHNVFQLGTNNTATSAMTPSVFRTLSAKIDNDGNVWLACWRYIGGVATTNNRICVYKINKSNAVITTITEFYYNVAVTINSLDTLIDREYNRFHVVYHINSASRHFLLAYNCTNNSNVVNHRELTMGTSSATVMNVKLVESTIAQNQVVVLSAFNGTADALRAQRYSIGTSPAYGEQSQANTILSETSNGNVECVLDGSDLVVLNVRNGGTILEHARLNPAFTLQSQYAPSAINLSSTIPTGLTAVTNDLTHGYLSYTVAESNAYNRLFYTKIRLSDGATSGATGGVLQQRILPNDAVQNFNLAYPVFENRSGTISLFYEKETGNPADLFAGVQFGNYTANTKIEIRQSNVSNTGESNWVTVYDSSESIDLRNTIVTIGSTKKDRVQLRFTLSALNGTSAVTTLSDYSVSVPTSNSTGEFYSNTIISDRTVAKVNLSADITLGNGSNGIDGSVTWFASNNNGANYYEITLGQDYLFSTIGNQLKVKAVIAIPDGSSGFSPRIQNYSVVAGNVAQQSDLVILNVNLMKTTLQLNTLLTAQRLSWTNMMVDTFSNGDGVTLGAGVSLTGDTITGTGTVTSALETSEITVVNSVIVVAEYQGTVTFEFTRDDGVNWQPLNPDTLTTLTLGTTKNKLRLRANLTSGTLYGWAYLYA